MEQIPFLPVGLFKQYDLKSVDKSKIHKTVQSSGTTSQSKSKIYLDRQTSALQSKVLAKILSSYLGQIRLPTIIIDTKSIVENITKFSARSAGIQGFSLFSKDRFFALDENMKLDFEGLKEFSYKYKNQKILIFGFTFMIWQHFLEQLIDRAHSFDFTEGILFHAGGKTH